jgi:hypothetical protein
MFSWFEIKSPLTDLLAVYFGLGVFMANNAIREVNWRSAGWSGWSLGRQGYMTMPEYAYALALYSLARGEQRPHWARCLRPDVRAFFKYDFARLGPIRASTFGSCRPSIARTLGSLVRLSASSPWRAGLRAGQSFRVAGRASVGSDYLRVVTSGATLTAGLLDHC